MKRSEFFSEMGKGLFQTVKELSSPFVSENLTNLDQFVDQMAGFQWVEACSTDSFLKEGIHIHDLFIGGKPISVVSVGQEWSAINKVCPTCQSMVQWISYEKKFSCFYCEKSYYIESKSGELSLAYIPLKTIDGKLYLGLKKDR